MDRVAGLIHRTAHTNMVHKGWHQESQIRLSDQSKKVIKRRIRRIRSRKSLVGSLRHLIDRKSEMQADMDPQL